MTVRTSARENEGFFNGKTLQCFCLCPKSQWRERPKIQERQGRVGLTVGATFGRRRAGSGSRAQVEDSALNVGIMGNGTRDLPDEARGRWKRERGEMSLSCCVSNQLFPEGPLGEKSRKQTGGPRSAG